MTFLPIVERELRVAARRRGTHWGRLFIAFFAILTGIVIFFVNSGVAPQQMGQYVFMGLAVLCMIYCVFSGRIATADCLSEEKREGTLGLLFLTDLKGYDIVLGKLVSTSLGALYGLLAVLPVLALPLLMGGVTNGEFWRVVLVLVNTFLFSLAIGIFGSAVSRDARRAMGANLALLLLFMAALPLGILYLGYWVKGRMLSETLLSCPFYSFYLCADKSFKAQPNQFWLSTCIIAALTFLLLALASRIIPRTWQDKSPAPVRGANITRRGFWHTWSYGDRAKLGPFRKRLLDANAFYWLAARARLKPHHVWVFLGLMAFWWLRGWMEAGSLWLDPVTGIVLALILNTTLKAWIALEAGQQLAEDQKAGALELLLVTPLTVRDIVRGQFLALRRQFLKPLLVIISVELILMTTELRHANSDKWLEEQTWLSVTIMLAADIFTLPLVAMRVALTAKSPARATLSTILRILILPWILLGLCAAIANIFGDLFSPFNQPLNYQGPANYLAMWFWAGIAVDLVFGLWAWRQLLHHFRELATRRFTPPPSRALRKLARRQAQSATRFSTRKKAFLAGTALAAVIAGAVFVQRSSKPDFPPPLVLSITQSNAPLRVFPGWINFMILPDGTLWRWGAIGNSGARHLLAVTPEQIGTNNDWLQVSSFGVSCVGLHKDGTLWEWASGYGQSLMTEPKQIDSGHDWISVSTSGQHSIAIKKDGTLWTWGPYFANPLRNMGANSAGLSQVGTNADWTAALCHYGSTLGLRADGTIWIWGQVQSFGSKTFLTPTLFCRETNWTALGRGIDLQPWAQTASGEVWQLTTVLANPQAAALATGGLLATNSLPGHLVGAYVGKPELFELRSDGTLWEKSTSVYPQFTAPPDEQWRQVGKRSDWQSVWGGAQTAFGLTADGTLWTWGVDSTREGTMTLSMRFMMLQERIRELFNNGSGRRTGRGGAYHIPVIQKNPRPLLRLINSASPPTNSSSSAGSKD